MNGAIYGRTVSSVPKQAPGVDLISDALPFGRLWYEQAPDAVDYAKFFSRSHDAVIRVFALAGNVIETQEPTQASSSGLDSHSSGDMVCIRSSKRTRAI
jgi:hypothetical protein